MERAPIPSQALLSLLLISSLLACGDDTSADAGGAPLDAQVDARIDARSDASQADAATDAGPDSGRDPDASVDGGPPEVLKAFPSAFGSGAESSGGRGGVLIIINTPDPNVPLTHIPASGTSPERYEGGLYAALQHDGAAYITFDRSMNIQQRAGGTGTSQFSGLGIQGVHDKTIFGQSAPQGGVTITGGTFTFNGRVEGEPTRNLIFRYFRSRPILDQDGQLTTEPDLYTWGLLFRCGEDIIVDHCSFSFAQDKALGGGVREPGNGFERVTFSRNFVSDTHTGIYVEVNPGRPGDPEEYLDRVSFLSNMSVGMNRTPNVAFDGRAEVLNSVIYGNIYKASTIYHDIQINFIGNYYFAPEGRGLGYNRVFDHEGVPSVFASGNYYQELLEGTAGENNQAIFKFRDEYDGTVSPDYFVDAPFDLMNPHPPAVLSALEAHASVVTDGDIGADRYLDDEGRPQTYRDTYDTSQLEAVRTRSDVTHDDVEYWVLPVLPESTRPPSYDTDMDGLADAWELRVIGDLSQSYGDDHDDDGYENIEEYMNQVDE